jgi:transposase
MCGLPGMRQGDPSGTAPGSAGPLRPAVDRADCLSDGGLPHAAARGAGSIGTGSGHTAQSGKHPEQLGGSERGSGRALCGTGKATTYEPVVNSDETGYRTSGEKRWMWALVTANFVFYKIAASRGAEVLVELLGEVFAGILCSDRCASYLKYHKGKGQFCWAHFKRNILGTQEIGKTTDAERFCRDALGLHARLFRLWHRFRDGPGVRYGPLTREQLIRKSIPLEKKFFALADRYLDSRDKDVANLALALLEHFERFFAFLRHEGVEPTNNVAERALRCAVQWRKISFGSRSTHGEVAVARLLTVTRTGRMQDRAPLDYLVTALRAHRYALPIPSLLKTTSTT